VANEEPETVVRRFRSAVGRWGHLPALKVERPINDDQGWKTWTWSEYYKDVIRFAKSLIHLDVPMFARVSIIGFNAPEWLIADIGTIFAAGIPVGLYTTSTEEACEYLLSHSKSEICIVENDIQLQKILKIWPKLPGLKAIVQYCGPLQVERANVYTWDDFLKLGESVGDERVEERVTQLSPGHCCTLIYTSGTTGHPKAVMMSHDNLLYSASTSLLIVPLRDALEYQEHGISYLPLSHIAAQILDIYTPLYAGSTIWFARPDALKGSIALTLKKVRPTAFFGVPRVWEKFAEGLQDAGAKAPAIARWISSWAKGVGLAGHLALQRGEGLPVAWNLADKIVFSRVKAALGFDRCKVFITGAAPIALETLYYFLSLDVPILEVYGMSETSGGATASPLNKLKSGTCGAAKVGTDVVIKNPDAGGNGEVCMRGRIIFMGYLFNEKATKDTIDEEGLLHSGDIGRLDSEGRLMITGRLKELLITAGGENVAPVPIEEKVKEEIPVVSNCMLIGDRRKFLSLLITLKVDAHPTTGVPTDRLSQAAVAYLVKTLQVSEADVQTVSQVMKHPKFTKFIQQSIDRVNTHTPSAAANIKKWVIIPTDFSIPGEELGPTLKLKRQVVYQKYSQLIESLYPHHEAKL